MSQFVQMMTAGAARNESDPADDDKSLWRYVLCFHIEKEEMNFR